MTRNRPKRHHLISRSYLKAWTTDGSRVIYIDKETRTAKLVGTNDIFVAPHFLTVRIGGASSTALETAFGRVEGIAIPLVRQFMEGADGDVHHSAVKALIALHFARSSSVSLAYHRLHQRAIGELIAAAPDDAELVQAFHADHGRAPSTRELRDLVNDTAADFKEANLGFAESVQRMYSKALDYLEPLHLQRGTVLKPNRGELLVSDSAVVVNDGETGTASMPVALNDADFLWFPLGPALGVSLASKPLADAPLDEVATRKVNQRVWVYATRYVVARGGSNVNRALDYPDPKIVMS